MDLPDWTDHDTTLLKADNPAKKDLAQLHCLRSIAVSLEVIAMVSIRESETLDGGVQSSLLDTLDEHSVDKGANHARPENP